jgi:trans-2-enoyl-CoA reductase
MVTYGAMSRKPVQIPSSLFIFNDVILRGFHLARWLQKASPQERSAMLDQLVGMVRQGALNFAIERVAFSDFNIALQRAQDPLRDRKIVLVMDK